jgi:inosine/xanthosine triphosphatase
MIIIDTLRYMSDSKTIVAVGSTNPTKIKPVREVFSYAFKNVDVVGVSVSSGVKDQPIHDTEIYQGALNRAKKSIRKIPGAVYGVGIEGGLHKYSYGWMERSLVVIIDSFGNIGVGSSGGLVLPDVVIEKIQQGKTLEEAIDELYGTKKIGQGIGMFGIFTNSMVTRSEGVRHGVAFALARFLHKDMYERKTSKK